MWTASTSTNGYLHDLDGAPIGDEPSITVTNP